MVDKKIEISHFFADKSFGLEKVKKVSKVFENFWKPFL